MKRILLLALCAGLGASLTAAPAAGGVKAEKSEILPAGSLWKGKVELKGAARLFAGESIELNVTVFDTKGTPQQNRRVEFTVETRGGKGDAKFVKGSVITDKKGIATAVFTADSDPSALNIVKATAPGIKDSKNKVVIFKLKAWPRPLLRIAENYGMVSDWQAQRTDKAKSGGTPIPESKYRYFFKKPDKTKSISLAESANYSIFNNGVIFTAEKEKKPRKIDCKVTMGLDFEQVNYQYNPNKFISSHAMTVNPDKKYELPEVYRIEAVPTLANQVYSKIVVYADYCTGLDVEVEKYGTNKKLSAVTRIKRAKQWNFRTNSWTGKEFDLSKKYEPESVFLKTDFDLSSEADIDTVWFPVEQETTSFYGDAKDEKNVSTITTVFDDVQVNRGIQDGEFNIP